MSWLRSFIVSQAVALQRPMVSEDLPSSQRLALSSQWQALGPFQIGTREATWGADPLELYGGFNSLTYDRGQYFTSTLTPNATTTWSLFETSVNECDPTSCDVQLTCAFDDIDWAQMTAVYGWAATQYQAWIRGNLTVSGDQSQTVVLYTDQVLELFVDDEHHFGGDVYSFRRAPLVLHLDPGHHQVDLRLVRDVRAMGGVGPPTIDVSIRAAISSDYLSVTPGSVLMPDCLAERDQFASLHGSVMLRNDHIEYLEVYDLRPSSDTISLRLIQSHHPMLIAPGQTRPLAFEMKLFSACPEDFSFSLLYKAVADERSKQSLSVTAAIRIKSIFTPHKMTLCMRGAHGGYARAPVLLQLHGSGVDPENPLVSESLSFLGLCAWTIFPSGVTPWTGDDWHHWGMSDAQAAVGALEEWIEHNEWENGPRPFLDSWMVTGHSNGGQGVWYAMTHFPDKVFAGVPVAGYTSIQNYVSYDLWQPMDPVIRSIIDGTLATYRHELLASNMEGINVLSQHGQDDDNVPVFHARLMKLMISQANLSSNHIEVPHEGHVFDGMMSTDALTQFYQKNLVAENTFERFSHDFTLTVARPTDTGSKYGMRVLALGTPGRLGKVSVKIDQDEESAHCELRTSNVRTVSVPWSGMYCSKLSIDGQTVALPGKCAPSVLTRQSHGAWTISPHEEKVDTFGGLDNILRSGGKICIFTDASSFKVALQISRNLCQYYYADTEILSVTPKEGDFRIQDCGSRIHVFQQPTLRLSSGPAMPDPLPDEQSFTILDTYGNIQNYQSQDGLGAIYLTRRGRAEQDETQLTVWGSNAKGLDIAARLFPMLTGVGQPDVIVVDEKMLRQGAGGVIAMGFTEQDVYPNHKEVKPSGNFYFS